MLTRLDSLTFDFVLALIITDCLVGFFIWHEVFYNVGDTRVQTVIGVGAGIAISLAITIVTFAHWELFRMISERYKRIRYEQGLEEGKKLGRKEGREEGREEGKKEGREQARATERRRFRDFLEQSGIEITEEERERLFGEVE